MFRSSIRRMTLLVPRPSRAAPTFSRIPITRPLSSTSTHIATSPFTRPPRGAFSSQSGRHASVRMFHASRRNEGVPVWLLLILKSSSGLGLTQALGRITFSLIPLTMIQNRVLNKLLMGGGGKCAKHWPELTNMTPEKRAMIKAKLRIVNRLMLALLVLPAALFWITILVGFERTPLTGRWRLILLSPQEEEEISHVLSGQGWYRAVVDMLSASSEAPLKTVPPQDWRYQWVETILRRLEAVVPILQDEQNYKAAFHEHILDGPLLPPPIDYPLVPRPRAAQVLHALPPSPDHGETESVPLTHTHHDSPLAHLGPPYSLLIVDQPESNAFSYGFGGNGAGGVVLYTGFLDEVLATAIPEAVEAPKAPPSVWSLVSGSRTGSAPRPAPTPEQTTRVAMLLAHELSHLLLAHHLETLTKGTVLLPSVTSILSDLMRTVLFPFTFFFGPFVNDALHDLAKSGLDKIQQMGEACASRTLESEADLVSIRLLALAGFDPQGALDFWENRLLTPNEKAEQSPVPGVPAERSATPFLSGLLRDTINGSHPEGHERLRKLKEELDRWVEVRDRAASAHKAR